MSSDGVAELIVVTKGCNNEETKGNMVRNESRNVIQVIW